MITHHLIFSARALAALFFAVGGYYIACVITRKVTGPKTGVLHLCCVTVVGLWISSVLFHVLMWSGVFTLSVALLVEIVVITALRISGHSFSLFVASISADMRRVVRYWRRLQRSPQRWLIYGWILFALMVAGRVIVLPPIGWDSVRYHTVKAAMWVQTGGPLELKTATDWENVRLFPGGSEIFLAWAMLPFHNDFIVAAVDFLQWILLGVAIYALGRELRLRSRYRLLAAIYAMSIPAIQLFVGSNYGEIPLNLCLILSLVLTLRFFRTGKIAFLLLCWMALGVVLSIKITMLSFLILLAIVQAIFCRKNGRSFVQLGGIVLIGLSISFPWYLQTIREKGSPFYPMSFKLFGITLGRDFPAGDWWKDRHIRAYNFSQEAIALRKNVGALGYPSIVPLALFPLILYRSRRLDPNVFWVVGSLGITTLLVFYSPSFSILRLIWAPSSGRFLIPLILPAAVLSLSRCRPHSAACQLYAGYLVLSIVWNILSTWDVSWGNLIERALPLALLGLIPVLLVMKQLLLKVSRPWNFVFAAAFMVLVVFPLWNRFSESYRYSSLRPKDLINQTPRYWVDAANMVDTQESLNIAVTAGLEQNQHTWFLLYFLGRNLQNHLFYIPISRTGAIVPYTASFSFETVGDFDAWYSGVLHHRIRYVMSFAPPSGEMLWMKNRRDLFELVQGDGKTWGLYRVNKTAL